MVVQDVEWKLSIVTDEAPSLPQLVMSRSLDADPIGPAAEQSS
jgi:hypothetical protein